MTIKPFFKKTWGVIRKHRLVTLAAFFALGIVIAGVLVIVLRPSAPFPEFPPVQRSILATVAPPAPPTPTPEPTPEPTPTPIDRPVDFAELQALNADLYGWFELPGLEISEPLMIDAPSNDYYLTHDLARNYDRRGTLFMQGYTPDLSGPMSIIYGHNANHPQVFGQLKTYRQRTNFDDPARRTITIYTATGKFTYHIIAAFQTGNQHIFFEYNQFQTDVDTQHFIDEMPGRAGASGGFFDTEGLPELTPADRFITLSTCVSGTNFANRYVIHAVLIEELYDGPPVEPTPMPTP